MKSLMIAAAVALAMGSVPAFAQSAMTCKASSAEKKLAGAAQTSFMKKCETDAKAACDKQAADKKLSGAAKNSFTKKCITDAVGA